MSGRCAKRSAGQSAARYRGQGHSRCREHLQDRLGAGGPRVESIFDPLELADIEVRLDGHHPGLAMPLQIKRPCTRATSPDRIENQTDRGRQPGADPPAPRARASEADRLPPFTRPAGWRRRPRPGREGAGGISIDRIRAHYAETRTRSPRSWRRRCCSPPQLARRRSRGWTGSSASGRWRGVRRGRRRQDGRRPRGAAMLDSGRYTIIYMTDPAVGARGLYIQIVRALGATPASTGAAGPAGDRPVGRRGRRVARPWSWC